MYAMTEFCRAYLRRASRLQKQQPDKGAQGRRVRSQNTRKAQPHCTR